MDHHRQRSTWYLNRCTFLRFQPAQSRLFRQSISQSEQFDQPWLEYKSSIYEALVKQILTRVVIPKRLMSVPPSVAALTDTDRHPRTSVMKENKIIFKTKCLKHFSNKYFLSSKAGRWKSVCCPFDAPANLFKSGTSSRYTTILSSFLSKYLSKVTFSSFLTVDYRRKKTQLIIIV